jgi:hypothetical protein
MPTKDPNIFWSRVDKSGGPDACWTWTGFRDEDGYGRLRFETEQIAHGIAYLLSIGPVPDGLCVCHSCDNPPCCNPAHLWLGTNQDNTHDRHIKGRTCRGDNHIQHLHPEMAFRGSQHGMAILTENQVTEIRGMIFGPQNRRRQVAETYGVTEATIKAIRAGRIWKHLITANE